MDVTRDEHPICATCAVQHERRPAAGEPCVICADERQYVGWGGQRWTSLAELAGDGHRSVVRQEHGGLWAIGSEPSFGIGQRALVVPGEGGNVLWDCTGFVDQAGAECLTELGGIAAIAVSHPHFYGCSVTYSEAFGGDVPIYIHEADREWVRRERNVEFWSGTAREILPGRTLVNLGIHFAGGTVLHWADGDDRRGVLCSGDIFQVVMDRRWVSFMYSYPNLIPEHPDTIRGALATIEPYLFDRIYGAFWGRVVESGGLEAVRRSAQRYLDHIGDTGSAVRR